MRIKRIGALLLLSTLLLSPLAAKQPTKILMTGCGMTKLVMVDKTSNTIEWTHDLRQKDDCNDIEVTKENNILIAYKYGARMIDWNQQLIWDYPIETGEECNTATQLPNGNYLLGVCGHPDRLVELDKQGKKIKETTFTLEGQNVHGHFRQILPLRNGHFLVPSMGTGEVLELSESGDVIRKVKVDGNPFSVKQLKANRWLVSCGDAHCWNIVDAKRGEVIEKSPAKIGTTELLFVSEIIPLKSGGMIVTNWNGHAKGNVQPAVFETNRKGEIVWILPSSLGIDKVSAACLVP